MMAWAEGPRVAAIFRRQTIAGAVVGLVRCDDPSRPTFPPEPDRETVNVIGLKNNPSEALRKSHQGVWEPDL